LSHIRLTDALTFIAVLYGFQLSAVSFQLYIRLPSSLKAQS
jgi:hypothetical protein